MFRPSVPRLPWLSVLVVVAVRQEVFKWNFNNEMLIISIVSGMAGVNSFDSGNN